LESSRIVGQARLTPDAFAANSAILLETLDRWSPIDLITGPSGYGVPLVHSREITEDDIELMSFVRPSDRDRQVGIAGFRSWVRQLIGSGIPAVFLPGLIHLPTVPDHRKINTIDLGTPDKLCVAALALRLQESDHSEATFAVVEVGSAFTSVLVVERGKLVDAASGTKGPIGLRSAGAFDGEVAYGLSPLSKDDLFHGGLRDLKASGREAFRESLRKHIAALQSVTNFKFIYLSGSGILDTDVRQSCGAALEGLGVIRELPSLPGAWVKHASQGAALLADGLAGGVNADLVDSLELRRASGTILDAVCVRTIPFPWTNIS
jgi:predicted butyrate kinase (DUF1464 family)